ncbi:MAG: T9SS type A sorting domain-containing protein [Candidatus Sabulitectum sp.]|nr:T9SS type A sorting domain-containing protein [Candidatus Sabulitectum sp.]
MFFLLAAFTILATPVPTGITTLPLIDVEKSPLEELPASFQNISIPIYQPTDGNTVLVVVADYVATPLTAELSQFQTDLTAEGWNVIVQNMSGGTAVDLKGLLLSTPDIDGAIFIGFLPCAWYEEDYWAPEEFPCELYFMDLDGIWTDADSDGLFDSHTGDVAPEIWLGRIDAHAAEFGSETQMLSQYFQKNHLYRTGSLTPPSRALTFIDDDWSYYSDCGLNSIYGASNVTVVNSETQTTAENYLSRLAEGYEFIHLMAHSCPWGHTFKVPTGMAGTVMAPEIAQVNPNTAFLQLFSCSNARWVETGCLGNWYLFGTDMGLMISGAAKTGSMLDFEYFYNPVGTGSTFGEAFRNWWEYEAQGGFSSSERAWFYGNALLGDPTLKPVGGILLNSGVDHGYGLTDAFAVSTSSHSDCFPAVDTYGSITAIAWLTGENGRLDVAARFYDDSSDSWSQVYTVDADEYWDNAVSVCFDGSGVPWLAWSDFELSTYSYRIKAAHGIPFESVETVAPQEGYQVSPDLAYTDRMWLIWQDWEATGGRIMLKALDGSVPAQQLSSTGEWAVSPAISEGSDGKLHALWVKQTPAGSSIMWTFGDETGFSSPVEISSGNFCHSPHTSFVSGILAAAWQSDDPVSSITARIWDGTAWNPAETITSGENHFINPVVCATPLGELSLYWQEGRSNAVAMASVHTTSGWSIPFQPVSPSGPAWSPVASGNNIYWAGTQGGDWNIYTEVSTGIEYGVSPIGFMPSITSNPVRSNLEIRLPEGSQHFSGSISIFDITGRKVLESTAVIESGSTFIINCSNLPSGIYSLAIQNADAPVQFTLLR